MRPFGKAAVTGNVPPVDRLIEIGQFIAGQRRDIKGNRAFPLLTLLPPLGWPSSPAYPLRLSAVVRLPSGPAAVVCHVNVSHSDAHRQSHDD